MHTGIAGRVFASIGPAAKPVEVIHDAVADAIYDALDAAGHRHLGFTPIDVRYNTGLHISTNGRALDEILTRLSRSGRCR